MTAWRGVQGSRYAKDLFRSFQMPDGKSVMHFHHELTRLHSVHPGAEPGEQEPLLLSDVQQDSLPPPPPPYRPNAKDQPALRHFIYLGAPTPKKHTLDVGEHQDVWYGTVPNEQVTLSVRRREKLKELQYGDGANKTRVEVRSWIIDNSLWKPRKAYADSRSFWDTPAVFKRGMQIDWARCCTERFKKSVLPFKPHEDPVRSERELGRIKVVLDEHRQTLYQAFAYYCIGTSIYGNSGMWTQGAYNNFVNECKIVLRAEEEDKGDRASSKKVSAENTDLENLFTAASLDVPKSDPVSDSKGEGKITDGVKGQTLLRYGFVATIVRLSVARFKEEAAVSPAWAVERLISEHLLPNLPAQARCNPDDFRNFKLYGPEVEDVLRKHISSLRVMFGHYAAADKDAISQKGNLLSLDEFLKLLSESDLLDNCLTRREAAFAFMWSQMWVADEVKRREKLLNLTFEGFLEAIARLTLFKAIPTASQLVDRKVQTPADFFDQLDADGSYAGWVARNAPSWRKEESGGRDLAEVLDKLIALMIDRLDVDRSGNLTAKDFKTKIEAESLARARTKRQTGMIGPGRDHGVGHAGLRQDPTMSGGSRNLLALAGAPSGAEGGGSGASRLAATRKAYASDPFTNATQPAED